MLHARMTVPPSPSGDSRWVLQPESLGLLAGQGAAAAARSYTATGRLAARTTASCFCRPAKHACLLVVLTLRAPAPGAAQGAAGSLNFPASEYSEERQRFGPDLSAFLLQMGWAVRAWPACLPWAVLTPACLPACLSVHVE